MPGKASPLEGLTYTPGLASLLPPPPLLGTTMASEDRNHHACPCNCIQWYVSFFGCAASMSARWPRVTPDGTWPVLGMSWLPLPFVLVYLSSWISLSWPARTFLDGAVLTTCSERRTS